LNQISPQQIVYERRTEFLKLGSAEWLIVSSTLICFGLYTFLGLTLVTPWTLLSQRLVSLASFYLYSLIPFFLVVRFIHLRQQRPNRIVPELSHTWRYFKATQLNSKVLIQHARYLFCLSWLFVLFIQIKNLAPFIITKTFDSYFEKFERGMFGGHLPTQLTRDYFGTNYAELFSDGYFLFYPFVSLLIYIFLFQPNPRLRAEFLLAFSLTWIIGVLVVLILPTVGPCFDSELSVLSHELPFTGVSKMRLEIWNLRQKLLQYGSGINLISGFPSLHVAIVCLGAVYLRRVSIYLAVLAWAFLALTTITTLYFSWHYLLDDIGGIALALFSARFARYKYAQFVRYVQ
jgi:hypothetical protein